jgi:Fe-S-cluster containining protein
MALVGKWLSVSPRAPPRSLHVSSPRFDDARIHLHVLGREHAIDLRVRVGPAPVEAALEVARGIDAELRQLATHHARSDGSTITCEEGCAHCCRQLVPVSPVEAKRLAEVVERMPPDAKARVEARFEQALRHMESLGLLDPHQPPPRLELRARPGAATPWHDVSRRYFDAHLDCPFLEEERCTVYDERPLPCREYMVTSPVEACRTLRDDVRAVDRLVWGSEALTDAGNAVLRRRDPLVPLPLALEWARARSREYEAEVDGEKLFHELMGALAQEAPTEPNVASPRGERPSPRHRRAKRKRR